MAHARRKFEKVVKAYQATDGIAYDIMKIIKKLYKMGLSKCKELMRKKYKSNVYYSQLLII